MNKPAKLYQVTTIFKDFPHGPDWKIDARVHWFVSKRKIPVIPYEQGIKDYKSKPEGYRQYYEAALNERFTEEEANMLREYLLGTHRMKCKIEEVELPLEDPFRTSDFGYGHLSLGGYKEDDLPFKVHSRFEDYEDEADEGEPWTRVDQETK